MRKLTSSALIAAATLGLTSAALAQSQTYTTSAAFVQGVNGYTTFTFPNLTSGQYAGHTLNQSNYLQYNDSGATATGSYQDNNDPYPDGVAYSGSLGASTVANTGQGTYVMTNGGTALGSTFSISGDETINGTKYSSSYIKGTSESGGYWQVLAGDESFLGGVVGTVVGQQATSAEVTINLGGNYTAFSTYLGTNVGAQLSTTFSFLENGVTVGTYNPALVSNKYNGSTTYNPDFVGYTNTSSFNQVVVSTQLANDKTASNATYPNYGNTAAILLDQVQVGAVKPAIAPAVPEPGIFVTAGSLFGMTGLGMIRGRRRAVKAAA